MLQQLQIRVPEGGAQADVPKSLLKVIAAHVRLEERLRQQAPHRHVEAPKGGVSELQPSSFNGHPAEGGVGHPVPDRKLVRLAAGLGRVRGDLLQRVADLLDARGHLRHVLRRACGAIQQRGHGTEGADQLYFFFQVREAFHLEQAPNPREGIHLLIQNHHRALGLHEGGVEGPLLGGCADFLALAMLVEGQEAEPEDRVLRLRPVDSLVCRV
mmetsp:Transcript_82843/g.268395  ORF Transcript_82843/g.268395 Transcript_82843/m.268395 type:complete len:213 (+) Transcript_82843:829-1467(+)